MAKRATKESYQRTANRVLKALLAMPNNGLTKRHRGGWFSRRDHRGTVRTYFMIGHPPYRDRDKCLRLSLYNGQRLHSHPEHLSSWQSRRPKLRWYGGAIRMTDGGSLSFWGLPEKANEALVLMVALIRGRISFHEEIGFITTESQNDLFFKFGEYLCSRLGWFK
ncbi:hypothetical protein EPO05_04975 [Patescibacteria group bacterium]|nr:MAG: hypothetical protein EPO05_04975 [Patescibacteria group bacterium]